MLPQAWSVKPHALCPLQLAGMQMTPQQHHGSHQLKPGCPNVTEGGALLTQAVYLVLFCEKEITPWYFSHNKIRISLLQKLAFSKSYTCLVKFFPFVFVGREEMHKKGQTGKFNYTPCAEPLSFAPLTPCSIFPYPAFSP